MGRKKKEKTEVCTVDLKKQSSPNAKGQGSLPGRKKEGAGDFLGAVPPKRPPRHLEKRRES